MSSSGSDEDIQSDRTSAEQEPWVVRCFCGTEVEDKRLGWVQCDGCDVWQHSWCGGFDEELEKDETYFCDSCETKKNLKPRTRPSKEEVAGKINKIIREDEEREREMERKKERGREEKRRDTSIGQMGKRRSSPDHVKSLPEKEKKKAKKEEHSLKQKANVDVRRKERTHFTHNTGSKRSWSDNATPSIRSKKPNQAQFVPKSMSLIGQDGMKYTPVKTPELVEKIQRPMCMSHIKIPEKFIISKYRGKENKPASPTPKVEVSTPSEEEDIAVKWEVKEEPLPAPVKRLSLEDWKKLNKPVNSTSPTRPSFIPSMDIDPDMVFPSLVDIPIATAGAPKKIDTAKSEKELSNAIFGMEPIVATIERPQRARLLLSPDKTPQVYVMSLTERLEREFGVKTSKSLL